MGSASVADTGRFNTSKSPSDPQRKTVGKKIAQIRQGGSDSRKVCENASAKSASEQVNERKNKAPDEKEAMEAPPKPSKKTLSNREKKGDKCPEIAQHKYSVLDDILDASSMDYDDLDDLGSSPPRAHST